MKELTLLIGILLLSALGLNAQSEKNIVKSYQYTGVKSVLLAVDGQLEIEEWDEKIVRLVTTIDALNFNEATLKALIEAGRYTCDLTENSGSMIFTMLKAHKDLILRGVKIEERFKIKIFVPRGVTVEQVKKETVSDLF